MLAGRRGDHGGGAGEPGHGGIDHLGQPKVLEQIGRPRGAQMPESIASMGHGGTLAGLAANPLAPLGTRGLCGYPDTHIS